MQTLSAESITANDVAALEGVAAANISPALRRFIEEVVDFARSGETVYLLAGEEELTPNEAAKRLKMSRTHLCKLLDKGEIPSHKVGTHRRVLVRDLIAFNERRHREQFQLAERFAHQGQTARGAVDELASFL